MDTRIAGEKTRHGYISEDVYSNYSCYPVKIKVKSLRKTYLDPNDGGYRRRKSKKRNPKDGKDKSGMDQCKELERGTG